MVPAGLQRPYIQRKGKISRFGGNASEFYTVIFQRFGSIFSTPKYKRGLQRVHTCETLKEAGREVVGTVGGHGIMVLYHGDSLSGSTTGVRAVC